MSEADADEALRFRNDVAEITEQLAKIENSWCQKQEHLEAEF